MPPVYLSTPTQSHAEKPLLTEVEIYQPAPPRKWSIARALGTATLVGSLFFFFCARPYYNTQHRLPLYSYIGDSAMRHPNLSGATPSDVGDCPAWSFGVHLDNDDSINHVESASVTFWFDHVPTEKLLILSLFAKYEREGYEDMNAAGSIRFIASEEVGEKVKVELVAKYPRGFSGLLDDAKACVVSRGQRAEGVALFTHRPRHQHERRDHIHYEFTVHLPSGKADTDKQTPAFFIPGLETRLPLFAHVIEDLSSITFGSVTMYASDMPISSQFLRAEHVDIRTSNGPIEGTFNSSSSVELRTSNVHIKAVVGLKNSNSTHPTTLTAMTTNAHVDVLIDLTAPPGSACLSSHSPKRIPFSITTNTSNGPLAVSVASSLTAALLTLNTKTTNAPAAISLTDYPSYQGTFSLASSSWARPRIEYDENVEDPAGRGRKRVVSVTSGRPPSRRGLVEGKVEWVGGQGHDDDGEVAMGSVRVSTSNSPEVLRL